MAGECAASGGQDPLSEPQVQSLLNVQRPQVAIALVWGPNTPFLLLCDVVGAVSGYSFAGWSWLSRTVRFASY